VSRPPAESLRLGALALGVGLGLGADALRRAALSASYPFDLNFWSEDYFMTSMLRLARGAPTYAPVADASSSIYAPGGPWLHHLLLAPFGLSTSVVANRWLSQLWQLGAIALGVVAAIRLVERHALWPAARALRLGLGALIAAALLLAAYANPVATSLHPVAWENLAIAALIVLMVDWDRHSLRARTVAAAVLPALGFVAKQSAGPAIALSLLFVIALDRSLPRATRASLSLLPVVSLAATALGLHVSSNGRFTDWGISLLAAQGFEGGSKLDDALGGVVLWFLPSLTAALWFSFRALRRRSPADRAWLRAALVPLFYAPMALVAFFKRLGGENNLAALGFVIAIVAVAALVVIALERPASIAASSAALLMLVQIAALRPRRQVPSAHDVSNGERICGYAAARLGCGEKVLLGRGTSCIVGADRLPLDRMVAIHDAWVAGRADELGVWDRIARAEYDLVMIHHTDLQRFGRQLWPLLSVGYRAFYTSPHSEPGNFWRTGWQGYASQRMLFFEKRSAAGEHRVTVQGRTCSAPRSKQHR
jgi:hypothetical protein